MIHGQTTIAFRTTKSDEIFTTQLLNGYLNSFPAQQYLSLPFTAKLYAFDFITSYRRRQSSNCKMKMT